MANTSTHVPQTSPSPAPSDAVTNAWTTQLRFALQIVLIMALLGATFSGVSTYRDFALDSGQCTPIGPAGSLFGYPPCLYGLTLFVCISLLAAVALLRTRPFTQ